MKRVRQFLKNLGETLAPLLVFAVVVMWLCFAVYWYQQSKEIFNG